MPCPYFEPRANTLSRTLPNARLPLIGEYGGLCHAGEQPVAAPADLVFRCCNQGHARENCGHFPPNEIRVTLRYSITRKTPAMLELLCIEEVEFAPVKWYPLRYFIETGVVEPESAGVRVRAQAAAFCRSYIAQLH